MCDITKEYAMARNPNTSAQELDELAKHEEDAVRMGVYNNPNATSKVVFSLKNEGFGCRCECIHAKASTRVLYVLAKDEDKTIRRRVANCSNTPSQVLNMLAKDEDRVVKENVIYNPNTSLQTLEMLAKDGDDGLVWEIVCKEDMHPQIIDLCVKSKNRDIRGMAAECATLTANQLLLLSQDEDEEIRRAALARL